MTGRQRCRWGLLPAALRDAMIAGIAQVHRFAVATRDVAPFTIAGVDVVDPFGGALPGWGSVGPLWNAGSP